jgi:hypothetical protein
VISRGSPVAVVLGARAVYGVGLLALPARILAVLARSPLDSETVAVARVLGARQLVQAVILARHPERSWRIAGAGVDALHAGSMAALARFGRRPNHRRLAARNARTATLLGLTGFVS